MIRGTGIAIVGKPGKGRVPFAAGRCERCRLPAAQRVPLQVLLPSRVVALTCALVLPAYARLRRRFRNPRVERVQRVFMFRKLIDRCKRQKNCPYCGEYNATVKWVPWRCRVEGAEA